MTSKHKKPLAFQRASSSEFFFLPWGTFWPFEGSSNPIQCCGPDKKNADLDPDPAFDKKNCNLLIPKPLSLHKGRPCYRRSLQPSKDNIQHFKEWNLLSFCYFCGYFCPPLSGSGSRDPIGYEYGSTILLESQSNLAPELLDFSAYRYIYCTTLTCSRI